MLGHHTNFYELLYAFDVFRGDFRGAAEAMYSLALRLSSEHFPLEDERAVVALESQRDAYLGWLEVGWACLQIFSLFSFFPALFA